MTDTLNIPNVFAAFKCLLQERNVPYASSLGLAICLSHQHDMVKSIYPYTSYRIWSCNLNPQRYMGFYIIEAESPGECFLCQQGKGTHDPQQNVATVQGMLQNRHRP
jgi:hypothetical protein